MLPSQESLCRYADDVSAILDGVSIDSTAFSDISHDLARTDVVIPVVGGFSAGKSSLLNALLDRPILPVGLTPETELATELRYSVDEHLLAWRSDGTSERMELANISSIKTRAAEFTHLQAFIDSAFLAERPELVLVDMPGFGSSFANHDKAVAYYLPRGAHFIAVISVEDGNLTHSMTRQLSEIHGLGRSLTFVLSKTDLRAAEDVEAVAELVRDQAEVAFDGRVDLHLLERDAGKGMRALVEMLDPDEIVRSAYTPLLKNETLEVLGRINIAVAAFQRDDTQNRRRRDELASGLQAVEAKRDDIIKEIQGARVDRAVDRCMREMTRELDQAQGEFVQAAMSGSADALGVAITQITRNVVGRVMQGELRDASQTIASAVAGALKPVGSGAAEPAGLGQELLVTVQNSLKLAGETLNSWSTAMSSRNAAETKKLKEEMNWKQGQPIPRAAYQGLTTVLAVTTNVVTPLVELAIIFLPTIIDWVKESRARDAIGQRIANDIIPAYIRGLRDELPAIVSTEVAALVEAVTQRFENEIEEQRRAVSEALAMSNASQGGAAVQIAALSTARNAVQRLANEVLYSEAVA
ncbi:dynamin family protein [Luteibacter sp. dw_328]|uniref:dynamin family protein n=1 Tax=Luteibacter sp. dw_328 TaxID=2719796 RepID=UPI001BD532AD|nr:dynamin family protein [Luteibacter sp. dw_328]